jgi:hypothetical protein
MGLPLLLEKSLGILVFQKEPLFCVGIVDGIFVYLCEKPQVDLERKQRYSMNVQIERREIIYYQTGYLGSCPDTVCFWNCEVFMNPERYFSAGEYLLADGCHILNTRTLVPYRNHQESEKLEFNRKISSARIIVEFRVIFSSFHNQSMQFYVFR